MVRETLRCRAFCAILFVTGIAIVASASVRQEVSASTGVLTVSEDGKSATVVFTIKNPSMYDVYLVSGATEVAEAVEFRKNTDGESKKVPELTVPAYGSLSLSLEASHLAVSGLEQTLKPGESVELTLTTDGNQKIKVSAKVSR